jgi:hypothetical protein
MRRFSMTQGEIEANRTEARARAKAALHPDVVRAIEEGMARAVSQTPEGSGEPAKRDQLQAPEEKLTPGVESQQRQGRAPRSGQGDRKGQTDSSGQDLGRLAAAVRERRGGEGQS